MSDSQNSSRTITEDSIRLGALVIWLSLSIAVAAKAMEVGADHFGAIGLGVSAAVVMVPFIVVAKWIAPEGDGQ